ncbi:hypothetical protein ACFL53_03775 [Pseudomonadota bacterium]
MDKVKKEFVLKIALSNSQSAAFQRAYVYKENTTDKEKRNFKVYFRSKLRVLEEVYKQPVNEEEHLTIITNFANEISTNYAHVLSNEKLRFGIAQKAVNLYLKFLWTLGYLDTQPIHCPLDRIVLKRIGSSVKWTELDCPREYLKLMKNVQTIARSTNKTIAEWEIDLWNKQA